MDLTTWFDELFIHKDAAQSQVAKRVQSIVKTPAKIVSQRPYKDYREKMSGADFDHSKKRLYVGPHTGHFFRKCPGTFGAACCNYYVLNLGVQCNMNCSYCYLQSYVNSPISQIYSNIEDALGELEAIAIKYPDAPFRVGTGETIDSLSLDDLTLYSKDLVEWFRGYPKLTCEFKTKSDNVKNFVHLNHSENVVVSFSVNPQEIVDQEEHRTASLDNRLKAARLCADNGYPVAFHIDPMIYTPQWKEQYGQLVDNIADLFGPKELKWVSVGALRYLPEMKHMLRERFGGETLSLKGEMFPGEDGKLRYDGTLRTRMFQHVIQKFRKIDPKYPVFLCMETPESWLSTYESTPRQVGEVKDLFQPIKAPLDSETQSPTRVSP